MNEYLNALTQLNIPTIIAVITACWFFTKDIKKEIHEMKRDNAEALKDIHKEFKFINIRLSRVEGTTYGKDIYKAENKE